MDHINIHNGYKLVKLKSAQFSQSGACPSPLARLVHNIKVERWIKIVKRKVFTPCGNAVELDWGQRAAIYEA